MKRLGKKGFTLVELMVVIVIIGILVAIIVPSVTSAVNSAKKQSALADAKSQLTTWSIEVATAGSTTTAQYFEGDDKTPLPLTEAEALRIAGEKVFMNTELGDIVIENGTARWAEADEFPPASGVYYVMKVSENGITITKMTSPESP